MTQGQPCLIWTILLLAVTVTTTAMKIRNQGAAISSSRTRFLQQQQPSTCNLDATTRQASSTLLFDFIGEPSQLLETEVAALEKTIRTTYNALPFCRSPHFLQMDSIHMTTSLTETLHAKPPGPQSFTLEFDVQFSCQGCSNGDDLKLLTYSSSSTCPCQGPYPSLFRIAFEDRFEQINRNVIHAIYHLNDLTEQQAYGTCPIYQEFTTSDVLVEFFGCPMNITQTDLDEMAIKFQDTYNRLNNGQINTRYCDPLFRQIVSIKATKEQGGSANDRRLENVEEEFPIQKPSSDRDLQETDLACPTFFKVRLDVVAKCRGCNFQTVTLFDEAQRVNFPFEFPGGGTSFNDFFARRKLQKTKPKHGPTAPPPVPTKLERTWFDFDQQSRALSDDESCLCPVDPQYRAVTEEEMIWAYDSTVKDGLWVEDIIEIEVVQCDADKNQFQTEVLVTLETDAGTITQDTVATLSQNLARSYNDLSDRFCDPLFRRVDVVNVNQTIIHENDADEVRALLASSSARPSNFTTNLVFSFKLKVAGNCRNCPKGAKLFRKNDAVRRLQLSATTAQIEKPDNKYRRLEDFFSDGQCYCAAVSVAEGAPTQREFAERYTNDFARLTSGGVLTNQFSVAEISEISQVTEPPAELECTKNADCQSKGNGSLCVRNVCLNEGNPRFTLTWTGDDDLDLNVVTPGGRQVSYKEVFDEASGGSFDTTFVQEGFGNYVESIYFPKSTAPGGQYNINVELFTEVNSADPWKLEVFAFGNEEPISVREGSGTMLNISFTFADDRGIAPVTCDMRLATVQCCEDEDCLSKSIFERTCVNRQCIQQASPRFTLTSYGNDDLQLIVMTPNSGHIFEGNPIDEFSGGFLERDRNKGVAGETWHTESVVFPKDAPFGEYIFFVNIQQQHGVQDEWQVVANVGGQDVIVETGSGVSDYFHYDVLECQQDGECAWDRVCDVGRCVVDGTPRFTLTWDGGDDLYMFVIPPIGNRIDYRSTDDSASGGNMFVDLGRVNGRYMEYAYFDLDGDAPLGLYAVGVGSLWVSDEPDTWLLTVYVGGESVQEWTGVGRSNFTFTYEGWGPRVIRPECVTDTECAVKQGQICAFNRCIMDGSPRFTLTWAGEVDFDLFVYPPVGQELFFGNDRDELSGGKIMADLYSLNGNLMENAYFGNEGTTAINGDYLLGVYEYNKTNTQDDWELQVHVAGQLVQSWNGTGNDRLHFSFTDGIDPPENATLNLFPEEENPDDIDSLAVPECSMDTDCAENNACFAHQCVAEGTPRFTLTWEGGEDLDLFVTPPVGEVLYFGHTFDDTSGGEALADVDTINGKNVESISFGNYIEATKGIYYVYIRENIVEDIPDNWVLTVHVNKNETQRWEGSGNFSSSFTYGEAGESSLSRINPVCNANEDCPNSTQVCAFDQCVIDGTPRFTLSWQDGVDLDLEAITPTGKFIHAGDPNDEESGGQLIGDTPAVNGMFVEYISFGLDIDAPRGSYDVHVNVDLAEDVAVDWLLTVHINGEEVERWTGQGTDEFSFDW